MKLKLFFVFFSFVFLATASETIKINNSTISIVKGDLVKGIYEGNECFHKLNTQALVNAANKELSRGGGVCGAIFEAAEGKGKQLQSYIKDNYPTGIKPGEAIITPSFNLKLIGIQHIIHAVGPIYTHHTQEKAALLLKNAYTNSLLKAQELALQSIAFPFISSGIYGYPKKEAATIALKAVIDYAHKNPESTLSNIYFVLNNEFDYNIFVECLKQV